MATTISANGSSTTIVNVDQASALIRTSLSKCGSCKTIKGNSTNDARLVDSIRGNKFNIKSLVMLDGVVSVDVNTTNKQRVDRVKLLSQAVISMMREGIPIVRDTLILEMDRLYKLYSINIDLKQPDSESFDSMIAEQLGQNAADLYCTPIREVPKSGDFSVANLSMTIMQSSCSAEGENPIIFGDTTVNPAPKVIRADIVPVKPSKAPPKKARKKA